MAKYIMAYYVSFYHSTFSMPVNPKGFIRPVINIYIVFCSYSKSSFVYFLNVHVLGPHLPFIYDTFPTFCLLNVCIEI